MSRPSAAIGIVKGQPFSPDAKTRAILDRAAKTAYKMSRGIGFEQVVSGRSLLIYPDRHWFNPIADGTPENPTGPLDLASKRKDGGSSTSISVFGFLPIIIRSVPA
jgi:hypothetical protein